MTRYLDEAQHGNSAARTKRQQEDQRRMAYRRAIEDFTAERRLQLELADFPDLLAANYVAAASQAPRRSGPPSH
ncbi:MAG: transcriptional regulator [Pseudomonas sp.]